MSLGMRWDVLHSMFHRNSDGQERRLSDSLAECEFVMHHILHHTKIERFERFETTSRAKRAWREKEKSSKPLKSKDFELLLAGSGRRIRTLTYGVRVRCATFTQSRYIANARVIIPNFRRMSSGIGKFSLNFFYCFPRQSMDTLSPVRRKYKTPSRTGFSSSRVSAAA